MKKEYLIPILAVMFIFSVLGITSLMNNNTGNNVGESITYGSNPCIFTTGEFEGRETPLGEMELVGCSSNVLYDTGKEGIEALIGGVGGADAYDWIELGNASLDSEIPQADKSEAYTPYGAVCGMDTVAGTYGTLTGSGNWSISNTFTSTCDNILINVTRLTNSVGVDLASNNFTLVTLQDQDQLLVNWTIYVT